MIPISTFVYNFKTKLYTFNNKKYIIKIESKIYEQGS